MVAGSTVNLFKKKAGLVSAVVEYVDSVQSAFEYVVDLCENKEACELLGSGCEQNLSKTGQELCESKQDRVIAAPGWTKKDFTKLGTLCKKKDFKLIDSGLRNHLAGIDIAFTRASYGIASTGSIVINSDSEELRIATMISEIHVALLPVKSILKDFYEQENEQQKLINKKAATMTAFITGASRTADIERILALGVHGPLELHILLLEDN